MDLIGFQDVAFLPTRACFGTTFLETEGRDESLRTTMCLKTVVGGKQGHVPCKALCFNTASVLCQSNFIETMRLLQRIGKSGNPKFCGYFLI